MRRAFSGVIVLAWAACASLAWAADQAPAKFPYVGELTGDRVNVRSGPGVNYQSLVLLSKGNKIIVNDVKGEWLKIRVPADVSLWISGKYVTLSKDGTSGTVKGTHVNVRARRTNGDVLGQVNTGDKLRVRGHVDDWQKIAPPEGTVAWISGKFVRFSGDYEKSKTSMDALAKFQGMMGDARDKYLGELQKAPQERDFTGVLSMYDSIIKEAPNDQAKLEAERQREFVESIKKVNDSFVAAMKPYEGMPDKLADLEAKYRAQFEVTPKQYTVTGWVNGLGHFFGRPGTHRLVKGDKTVAILKSTDVDIEEYRGQYVGVIGDSVGQWQGVPIIEVKQADVLYEKGTPKGKGTPAE